jgi:hypothetical protein
VDFFNFYGILFLENKLETNMCAQFVYLGETKFFSNYDKIWRTLQLWGYYDEVDGELTGINYANGVILDPTPRVIHRRECTTALLLHLWKEAEKRLGESLIFDTKEDADFEVIEPFESNVIPLGRVE